MKESGEEIVLKRAHVVIAAIIGIMAPALTAYGSYLKAFSDIQAQIAASRLDAEREFAKKEELKPVNDKLDSIIEDLGEIKGFLRQRR